MIKPFLNAIFRAIKRLVGTGRGISIIFYVVWNMHFSLGKWLNESMSGNFHISDPAQLLVI